MFLKIEAAALRRTPFFGADHGPGRIDWNLPNLVWLKNATPSLDNLLQKMETELRFSHEQSTMPTSFGRAVALRTP